MKNFKKPLFIGLAMALGVLAAPAQAAFITGDIGFAGGNQQATCSASPCAADGSDFTGVSFPATSPNAVVLTGSGDFAGLVFGPATFSNILLSSITVPSPDLIWTAGTFSFSASSVLGYNFTPNVYTIRLAGLLSSTNPAFDPTDGVLFFSGNTAGGVSSATWSASQAVPEPVSLALLGLGLAGLGLARRRSS